MIFYENSEDAGKTQSPLSHDVREYEQTARQSVSSGQLLTAIEVARDGVKRYGANRVLQQQLALALAQTGALDGAREVLGELMKESASDEETLCLLGRVYKELWRRAREPAVAAEALRQACKFYGEGFELGESYYPGINLAFTLAAAGELPKAESCARKVEKICRREMKGNGGETDGWLLATLAEALTHQGATVEAGEYYRKAAAAFTGRWRDLASMRQQAQEILSFYAKAPAASRRHWYDLATIRRRLRDAMGKTEHGTDWLDRCFEFPTVVVFAGHMLDHPGRTTPRFSAEREAEVREQIRQQLTRIKPGFGYASAACGADLIFCECLLEQNAKLHLVLPCPVAAFKWQSVSFAGPEWERRFHSVLGSATTCLIANPADYAASENDPASAMGLVYANQIITGLAVLQAQALDFELQAIAVWDGKTADGAGGTGSVVGEWRQRGLNPHIIPLGSENNGGGGAAGPVAVASPAAGSTIEHGIKAMLCAEVINFQKIGERQMPAFIRDFKGLVARLMDTMPVKPAVSESWGRSNYFVYDRLPDAASFALELRDLVERTDWAQYGLPPDLAIRIVLHAGPVYAFMDPVLHRQTCVGAHLARAARIEPITPAGQVYVTQEFAALCSGEDLSAVSFEFLGHLRTAKLFEDAPLYRLDRRKN
ncbi:MAG: TRAFs-binding domain-containing protein [Opitutaceae bacterium]|nr:TRAFs-binding domain-containing protein [Opitutaceae bacterium]